jgi:RimJ/RimL family protein N-acetyltransferase
MGAGIEHNPDQTMNAAVATSNYQASAMLLDGGMIIIRAIRPDDRDRLLAHFGGLSTESRILRFHGARRSMGEAELTRLTQLDFVSDVGLVATFGAEPEQPLIGVAHYLSGGRRTKIDRAEVGFSILDKHQGKGIGSALLHHLALIGKAAGLREFQADVMANNYQMIEVLEHSGFKLKRTDERGVSRFLLTIG